MLAANPYLIQYAIPESGHHGTWVYPKQMIKLKAGSGAAGLIPDFLVVTRSSLGDAWWVVEIKRFDHQFADKNGTGMSRTGHLAIVQCAKYLDHFREYIDVIRTQVRVPSMTQAKGALLLIGDSETESDAQRNIRSAFVRTSPLIDVASYRRILYQARADVGLAPSP